MRNYIGLDVSMKTTSVCFMNENGKVLKQCTVATNPEAIMAAIMEQNLPLERVALECGGISHWLTKHLKRLGLPIICIDARKMSAAISIRANKTDKNDAQEIANALRTGYYKEVYQKQDYIMEKHTLLSTRRSLIEQRTQLINTIRGLMKLHGILDCGSSSNDKRFSENVRRLLANCGEDFHLSINGLLNPLKTVSEEITKIDSRVEEITEGDEDVRLLKTIPGVGAVTALTFVLEIDNPARFKKSKSVGAYFGMTPTQYSSGETHRQGGISKMGSNEMRALLSQAAMSMMYCTKRWSCLKLFGLKIRKKHGHGKAIVALGRKLGVVMHRMLLDRKPFEPGKVEQKEIDKLEKKSKREIKRNLVTK